MRICERCGAELTKPRQKRFCSRGCALATFKPPVLGVDNPRFNGGLCFNQTLGRWVIHCRDGSLVYYSRAVVSAHLGRLLGPDELVHHRNEDTTDDRLENLRVTTRAEHIRHHMPGLLRGRGLAA